MCHLPFAYKTEKTTKKYYYKTFLNQLAKNNNIIAEKP